jgi:ParB-like chromosome segregation protein Spo0J
LSPLQLPTSQLRYSKTAWPRAALNQERVQLFSALLGAGEELPPIEVVPRGDGTFLIADGVHRSFAATAVNRSQIDAVILSVEPGESAEACAFRRALETATRSALPLTTAERRVAALRLVKECPDLSHRAIARLVGVSHDSVDRWAKGVAESVSSGETSSPRVVTADEAARRLVNGLVRLHDSRGLLDMLKPQRMGRHLADAFEERLGDEALARAKAFADWADVAVQVLEDRHGPPGAS